MKEGMDRRALLKTALAAALAAAPVPAEAKQETAVQKPGAEKAREVHKITNELREKVDELKKAFENKDKDPQAYEHAQKEMDEFFKRTKPFMDNLQK